MRILITGASGFIGSHLLQELSTRGHEVTGCIRYPDRMHAKRPGIRFVHADFTRDLAVSDWLQRLRGIDVVINAVGIIREHGGQRFDQLHRDAPIALFRACREAGVRRVIQISALGADDSAFSHYHLSKRAADDFLAGLDLSWTILMPSIVYGPGAKSMAFFKALACLPLTPLVDRGEQAVQPIHIKDLTRMVSQLVESDTAIGKRLELVGPQPLPMKSIFGKLRRWMGLGNPRFLAVPYPVALGLARLDGFMGDTPLGAEAVAMLQRGNTADVKPVADTFGFLPKGFDEALAELPAQDADRWHAGLYFIRPLLRWSIAFVWLFTGFISAFIVPSETSFALLAKAGISGIWAPIILYAAATSDMLLGAAILSGWRPGLIGAFQLLLIAVYTLIITLTQPEQWLHPFGPVTKNAPLAVAILISTLLERRP